MWRRGKKEASLFVCCLGLDEVVDVDVEVVFELDEVDGGLGLHLLDDQSDPLAAVLHAVLHVLPHQAVHHLARLRLLRRRLFLGHGKKGGGKKIF